MAQTPPQVRSITQDGQTIWYNVKGGYAVTEGDILLGPEGTAGVAGKTGSGRGAALPILPNGSIPAWPQGHIYYTIDPDIPNPRRITDAIEHWNTVSVIRLLPRTGQANYLRFVRPDEDDYCASFVGMRGGEQEVFIGDECPTGAVIHEIGHGAGLLHEQDRLDRNRWITIQYENIGKWNTPVYSQFLSTLDAGYYNYDSIMHYSPYSFTSNIRPTIQTVPPGIQIGARTTLSAGDLDVVSRLYGVRPTQTTITTMPAGLRIKVDGEIYTAPRAFDWAEGSTHTVSVEEVQATTSPTRYRFVRWTDSGTTEHTVTASPNQTVIAATFAREHRVDVLVLDGDGKVNVYPPSADGYYPAGTRLHINAIPAFGHQFLDWISATIDLEIYDIGYGSQEFDLDLFGNLLLGAVFTDLPVTTIDVKPNDYSLVGVDGNIWVPPVRFAWEPGTRHTIATLRTNFSFDGSKRYSLLRWSDGSIATSRQVVAGTESAAYVAAYRSDSALVLGWAGDGEAASNPPYTDGYFSSDSTVLLNAVPDEGNELIFWLGDVSGRGRNKAIAMDDVRLAIGVFGAPVPLFPFNAAHRRSTPLFDRPSGAVAPLEEITLTVTGLKLRNPMAGEVVNGRYATTLGGFRVLFDGVPAPIVRLGTPDQITVVVPAAVSIRTSTLIEVERNGEALPGLRIAVAPTVPGIYTLDGSGFGQASANNEDGSPNAPQNPALQGSVVTLRVTGAGMMDRNIPDGSVLGSAGARPRSPIYVRIAGLAAEVLSAEPAAGSVNGVLDVKVRVPRGLIPGNLPVQFIAGVYPSPPFVTLAIR